MHKIIIVLSIFSLTLVSCITTTISSIETFTPLEGKVITEQLGRTTGEDSVYSIFLLQNLIFYNRIGQIDMQKAMREAIDKKDADTIVNVHCYTKTYYFLLFSKTYFIVEGDAVKIADVPQTQRRGR